MAFFLIVPSVMIVSVIIVHALANRLGLRIYYSTLIAAAVLAFMVDFAATLIAPGGGKDFLLRLGLMIFAASILLTLANRFLLKKERDEEKKFTEEVKAAYQAEIQKDSPPAESKSPFAASEWEESPPPPEYNEAIPLDEDKSTVEPEPEVSESTSEPEPSADVNESTSKPEPSPDVKKSPAEPVENSALPEDFPLEEVFEPLPEVKQEEFDPIAALEEKAKSEEKFPLEEVFKPLPEVKREEVKPEPEKIPKHAEIFPLQEVFQPLGKLRLDKIEEITRDEKNSAPESKPDVDDDIPETLDDILDKAYDERSKGHVWQAIELYKKALERYGNDEYAPFVAIDLGNLYKEQALYSKAIKIYEDALKLSAVKRNVETQKEFVKTLEYLRVVRDVLLKYHALSTPFGELSKEILQEIDTEFQKVQIHSAQSR